MNYFEVLVWPGGGVIGILLWALSFVTLGVMVELFFAIRRTNILPNAVREKMRSCLQRKQYRDAIDIAAGRADFLSQVVHAALLESPHGYAAMERAIEETSEERTTKLLRHIEPLNLIGNISPMVGLLGTVWGMINAFFQIVQAGGIPEPGELAGAIGIALVTTLVGLGIAIPALAVYSLMRSRIDELTSEAIVSSQELVSILRPPKDAPLYGEPM